jgi:hypothetical protein
MPDRVELRDGRFKAEEGMRVRLRLSSDSSFADDERPIPAKIVEATGEMQRISFTRPDSDWSFVEAKMDSGGSTGPVSSGWLPPLSPPVIQADFGYDGGHWVDLLLPADYGRLHSVSLAALHQGLRESGANRIELEAGEGIGARLRLPLSGVAKHRFSIVPPKGFGIETSIQGRRCQEEHVEMAYPSMRWKAVKGFHRPHPEADSCFPARWMDKLPAWLSPVDWEDVCQKAPVIAGNIAMRKDLLFPGLEDCRRFLSLSPAQMRLHLSLVPDGGSLLQL